MRLLVVCFTLAAWLSSSVVAGWSPETSITPSAVGASAPALATGPDGRVHCVYPVQASGGQLNIVYRCWDGVAWSTPYDLPSPNFKEPECDIAVGSDNRIHVVGIWRVDGTTNTPYTVYYWEHNGSTWVGPTMLSSGIGSDADSCKTPRVAVDRFNDVHVVWTQGNMTGGAGDIMYRKRQAGVWQPVYNITKNPTGYAYGSVSPDIAVDRLGNTVHVVWHDDSLGGNTFQVWYTNNTNLGSPSAWLSSSQWFMVSFQVYGKSPKIILDRNDRPNIFWIDKFGGSQNVQAYRRWDGTSWTYPINLGAQWFQDGVFDQNNVLHYVFTQGDPLELFYRTYDFATFSNPELISAGVDTQKVDFAAFALDGRNSPVAVWEERKNNSAAKIYYSVRRSCGVPEPVTSFSAKGFDGEVRLSWSNPLSPGFSATMIRYKTTGYPTGPDDGYLVCDRVGIPGTADQFVHANLSNGTTYYYAAFAHDDCGNFAPAALASATPHVISCIEAKHLSDGTYVYLRGKSVTGVFSAEGCFYIEEPDRTSGIRVAAATSDLSVGDVVNVGGSVATRIVSGVQSERQLAASVVEKVSQGRPLRPVGMGCFSVGGAPVGPYQPGVVDANGNPGIGVNTMGLLVRIVGRVTAVVGSYIWLDDGSHIPDVAGRLGVCVRCPSTPSVSVGDFVSATGVVEGAVPVGWLANRRQVRIRSASDLVVLN
ncbi:MAG: hypothetical protein QHI38_01345 [Armatimonadota bacterium]|nr:hypothetical protein [Armatimonadota bacterium]